MSQLQQDLTSARALIDTPEKWCHNASYRGEYGKAPMDAISALVGVKGGPYAQLLLVMMIAALPDPFMSITEFNDHPDTTHADIMSLFDRAIAQAGA